MPLSGLVVEPPRVKWVISMESERISSASTETVRFPVFADSAGGLVNPTSFTVAFALLSSASATPVVGDWKAGTWDVNAIGGYVAQLLVGPSGGATNPGSGTYYCWIQITGAGETVVRQVGQLIID